MQEYLSNEDRSIYNRGWQGGRGVVRLLLFLYFLIPLAIFFHFREKPLESLEVGTRAPRYVIAQIDFDFPDQEATQVLQQEAAKDIGGVYAVEEAEIRQQRYVLEKNLINAQTWREELPYTSFEEIGVFLDAVEERLLVARFASERTLQRMKKFNLSVENFYAIKISHRHLADVTLPLSFWEDIERRLSSAQQPDVASYVIALFSSQNWKLYPDYVYERIIKQSVQNHVAQKYSHVEAGTQIVKRGEIVSTRHVTMLSHMALALAKARNLWAPVALMGSFLLALSVTLMALFYLRMFYPALLQDLRKMGLLITIFVLTAVLAKSGEHLMLYGGKYFIEMARFALFVPLAALLINVLIDSKIAFITSLLLLLILSVTLAVDQLAFFFINFVASCATILFSRALHKRTEVFSVFGKTGLVCIPVIIAFNLSENILWSGNILVDVLGSVGFLAALSLLVIALLPLLESLFHVMTEMTLMEYMDPNHELLRRLNLEAPGTYQHCLIVGSIAEAAARAISANGLFCRVATLYHDIGKLFNPHYFTENQLSGFNIHQLLTPLESSHVIIAHVPEGEALARKFHLPQGFIDIIREHHGTTMVYYFYCKQVEQMGGDPAKVNEKLFRYPGPKPRSKESGIIMIADTSEAASRSMEDVSEEAIAHMVDQLISEKIDDGQFDECRLTFEEIGRVKVALVKALMVTRHLRVKYPLRTPS